MHRLISLLPPTVILMITFGCNAQVIDIKKTTETVVINQTNQAINNGINRGVSAIFNAPGKIYRKIKDKQQQPVNTSTSRDAANDTTMPNRNDSYTTTSGNNNDNSPRVTVSDLKTIYGTDFKSGGTLLWTENFSADNTGKFPQRWITNSSGEVRVVNGNKWLQLSSNGLFAPETLKNLPENFTLEFDAIFNQAATPDAHYILYVYSIKDKIADFKETNYPGNSGIYFAFNTEDGEVDAESFENGKMSLLDFHLVTDALKSIISNKIHVGLNKNGTKVSLFLNGHEVFSASNATTNNYSFNAIKFGSFYMTTDDFMLISNFKIATD